MKDDVRLTALLAHMMAETSSAQDTLDLAYGIGAALAKASAIVEMDTVWSSFINNVQIGLKENLKD